MPLKFRTHLLALLLLAGMTLQQVHVASFEVRRLLLRETVKERIREGLPAEELAHFAFTQEEYDALEKEDGGREFWLDDHVYDVVRRSVGGDGLVRVEAVDDRDEARLMAGLGEMIRKGMMERGLGHERAQQVIATLACSMPERPWEISAAPVVSAETGHDTVPQLHEGCLCDLLRPPQA